MEVENKDFWKLSGIVLGLVAAIILLMLSGCRTRQITMTEVVEVPRIEHHYQNTTSRDTIFQKDSVTIFQRGDTIFNNTVQHHYHSVYLRDTISRNDTITVVKPVNVPVPVEKELSRWQKIKMSTGGYLFGLLGIAVVGGICYIFRRRIPIIKNLVK